MDRDRRIWWGEDGDNIPSIKRFISEVKSGRVPQTLWEYSEVGHTQDAKKELLNILDFQSADDVFVTPKPVALLSRILDLATTDHSIILDSFAGSGTTGHAVLAANKSDGGDRKFILVECENYAETLTAERIRRVVEGYDYQGNHRVELMKKSLTFTDLKKANKLLDDIAAIENLEGMQYDKVEKKVKDGVLLVEGVKQITERMEGLGGEFTYCTLGEAVDLDRMLTGEALPAFDQLGALLYHMATNEAIEPAAVTFDEATGIGYLGESSRYHVWLIYKPELAFLKSREAALTMANAQAFVAAKPGKPQLVFAAAKFVSQKLLGEAGLPVEYAPLPWALYRAERG
jgi:adenine-specific DNA-methyltransferase